MSSLCQICGARFYDSDLERNPLAHFCIGLDGPAIIHEEAESAPHTPELEKTAVAVAPVQHSIQLPAPAHAKEDLVEIARLRGEVEKLRRALAK